MEQSSWICEVFKAQTIECWLQVLYCLKFNRWVDLVNYFYGLNSRVLTASASLFKISQCCRCFLLTAHTINRVLSVDVWLLEFIWLNGLCFFHSPENRQGSEHRCVFIEMFKILMQFLYYICNISIYCTSELGFVVDLCLNVFKHIQ